MKKRNSRKILSDTCRPFLVAEGVEGDVIKLTVDQLLDAIEERLEDVIIPKLSEMLYEFKNSTQEDEENYEVFIYQLKRILQKELS